MWFLTGEGLLVLLVIAAAIRAFATKESDSEPGDTLAFVQFVGLVIVLSALCVIQVPIG